MLGTSIADRTITDLAVRQLGLVTSGQLAAAGFTRDQVRGRVERGGLARVGRRTFAVAGAPRTWQQAALAACLDIGSDALLSHTSAAVALKLLDERLPIEVTAAHSRSARYRRAGVVLHRTRALTSADRAIVGDMPVTTPARTLVDLAEVLEPFELASCVDGALSGRLVSPDRLLRAADRLAARGRRGPQRIRVLVRPWLDERPLDSLAEARVRRAISRAGLPAPVAQHEVWDSGVLVARLDFAWPDHLLALEVDGFRWHANPAAQVADALRASRLEALEWTLHRTTPAAFDQNPELVIRALRSHLERPTRSWEPAGAG